jgi:RNA polymerase sigma-70 factor (ECF subfamily)
MSELTDAFLRALPPGAAARFAAGAELDAALASLVATARAAWPKLDLDAPAFVEHVAGRLPQDTALDALHAGDLYLAFGCALGDPLALEAFEHELLAKVTGALKGQLPNGATADDVAQRLRLKLFVRSGDTPPGIWTYSGKGPLFHWLRASAIRVTQDLARRGGQEIATPDDDLSDTPALANDPDLALLKGRFAAEFKAAFQEALASLSAREQSLLRMQVIDGLSPDEIGRVYQTHRTTVWRWLTQCRQALYSKTRELLAARVKGNDSELSSLMKAVHSQLDVSLNRVLRKPD